MNPRRPQPTLARMSLLAALAVFLVTTAAVIYEASPRAQEPTTQSAEPAAQPLLAFSHRLHARDYEIRSQYCHAYTRRGPVAHARF